MVMISRLLSTGLASPNRRFRLLLRRTLLPLLLYTLMVLSGCGDEAGRPATQQRSATPVPSPTLPALATNTPASTPPPVVQATDAALSTPATTPCAHDYFFTPAPSSCPREAPVQTAAAEQPFERGVMIWLEATNAIYVFYPDGRWQQFADTWREGEPEGDPARTPPPDRYQPIRGFGKVWRDHPAVQEQLGWATSPELGYSAQIQRPVAGEGGDVLFVRTFNGQVYYLSEREPGGGEWGIAASW
ncbi:MAG: hypothetical protein RRC07_06755 [Anaerolineae bacterium]|nr:hypothetical protein [Anaerolineae bacterium]